ncbi:MAG: MFS transporter, partial [Eggerthella lenta]
MKRVKSERMGVYALFAIVVLASASGNLSQTAVNAMLGDIMLQFGLTVDLGQWLTTSYMLVLGITVPVATFLSRRFSVRRHVFIALAFFLVGALADLFAPNFGVLLAGRVFQAISTGMLMPLMQTIAMTRFPRGRQATAMGVAGIAMGFAPNIGPTIGGAMSFSLGWRSFFVLLVVIMLALAAAAAVAIKPSAAPDK